MTAEDLRKSILQQAIQGKLVPQDPTDEPASILLARIREEKARLIKEKKIKKDKNESLIYRGDDNSYYEKFADGTVKCIDEEIPFEIPQGWEWARMGSIGNWGAGATPSRGNSAYYKDGEILWLKTGELNDGVIYDSEEKITQLALRECSLKLNKVGDVLIAMYGATIGKLGIVGQELTTNQACCGCTPYEGIYNYYLFYFLMANKTNFIKQGEGGAQPNISRDKLIRYLIPIPPYAEQLRIADRIEFVKPLLAQYDTASVKLASINKTLTGHLKKSILQYAIQGKLVPQNPEDEPASELLKRIEDEKSRLVKAGKIKRDKNTSVIFKGEDNKYYEKLGSKVSDISDEIPYELPANWEFVRLSRLCWLDDGVKVSGEKLPYLDAKHHRGKGEVTYLTSGKVVTPPCKVILVDGENSGEIFDVSERGYLGSTFKVLQISPCISEEWLHILLINYRDLFKNSKVGAAIPHLNKNLFRNLIVGIPPLSEQEKIVSRIRQVHKSIEGV